MGSDAGVVWYMRTTEADIGSVRVLAVEGRISNGTAGELGRALARSAANRLGGVLVDLSGVDYINGAGLRAFETAARRLQGSCELVVCGLRPVVQTAFDLAGAIPNLATEPTREAALERVRNRAERGSSF